MIRHDSPALADRRRAYSSVLKKLVACCLGVSLIGCANLSAQGLFSHYSAALQQPHTLLANGEYQQALASLPEQPDGEILDGMEKGRLALLAGDTALSKNSFERADIAATKQQEAAIIQLSQGVDQLGALITNDNMIRYTPPDYELGFLHLYLTLGYLQNNDVQGALVEVRRANLVQERARKIRQDELESASRTAQQNGINENLGAVLSRYPDAGQTLGFVQNGYLFYLSALLYEAEGNLNSAFIDYSRALAVEPDNKYIAEAAMRIAFRQGRRDELRLLEKQYGKYQRPDRSKGQLVILSEQGVVNARDFWRLPLWLPDSHGDLAAHTVSLPYYRSYQAVPQRALTVDSQVVQPQQLANVNGMAQQALNEAMPAMAVRQILRVVAKNELRKSLAENDESGLGNVVVNIFNVLSEQPDTRSWQTLPESVGVYSGFYTQGQYQVNADGQAINVNVEPGKTTLVWLSRQGDKVVHWQGILGGIG
ncbi:COG3014 family protein [Grimontia hollisae]|uniref:COG3014 family protein n=1 Tax=Grimontia hollisae TaxID=673 RepID=UPI000DF9BB3B|nr:hypothetical protein [Grimontia hollisae]STQ75474.1 Uncharacterized protein conserved in bacteria [Grimontia hollisae]